MEKLYQSLTWLEMPQAVDRLQKLTKIPITERHLLQLCDSQSITAYFDVSDLPGSDMSNLEHATGKGIHQVLNPLEAFGGWSPEPILTRGDTYTRIGVEFEWKGDIAPWMRGALFQSVEIKALADKMNSANGQPAAADFERQSLQLDKTQAALNEAKVSYEILRKHNNETRQLLENTQAENTRLRGDLKQLRQQLEQNRTVQIAAEAEANLRKKIIMTQLACEDKKLESMILRMQDAKAEDEEFEVRWRIANAVFENTIFEHGDAETRAPSIDGRPGLTFPYTTKHLEAMCATALKYWSNHTPDKRQPTQKEVGYELCERLGLALQASNEPARKAIALATAIRPDTLPDA